MSNLKDKNINYLVDELIVFFLFIAFIFAESLLNLSMIFSYGFFKNETLTKESNLGFDMKIKIK